MATQNHVISTLQLQRNNALDAVAELNAKLISAAELIGKLEKENKELNERIVHIDSQKHNPPEVGKSGNGSDKQPDK